MAPASHPGSVFQRRQLRDAKGILGAMAEVDQRRGDVVIKWSVVRCQWSVAAATTDHGQLTTDSAKCMTSNSVITALEDQLACYRRLAKLAEAQHEHVQQSRMEPLLEVLRGRQTVLDQLTQLERVIGPAKK